jgi:1-acyl-sn-glycerol-3-phosphate acyltransferase
MSGGRANPDGPTPCGSSACVTHFLVVVFETTTILPPSFRPSFALVFQQQREKGDPAFPATKEEETSRATIQVTMVALATVLVVNQKLEDIEIDCDGAEENQETKTSRRRTAFSSQSATTPTTTTRRRRPAPVTARMMGGALFAGWSMMIIIMAAVISSSSYEVQAFTRSTTPTTTSNIATARRRLAVWPVVLLDGGGSSSGVRLPRQPPLFQFRLQASSLPQYINGDSSNSAAATTNRNKSNQSTPATTSATEPRRQISALSAVLTKLGMISFVVLMCTLLPLTLMPQRLLYGMKLITKGRLERWALLTSQWCARVAYGLVPFCRIATITPYGGVNDMTNHEPAIWVCNHTSMLDVFILLIADLQLRGRKRRPIKVIYWQQLEKNPVTKLMFKTAGFIPVDMAANAPGQDNEYDVKGFKKLLKDTKQAVADGFDIGILPEGQLNPTPEQGLLPLFTGAYTLAKLSKRPIGMLGLYGVDRLWGAVRGMTVLDRRVQVGVLSPPRKYGSAEDFTTTFTDVVGTFGQGGGTTKTAGPSSSVAASSAVTGMKKESGDAANAGSGGEEEEPPIPLDTQK